MIKHTIVIQHEYQTPFEIVVLLINPTQHNEHNLQTHKYGNQITII
jgi:hypothetical protein